MTVLSTVVVIASPRWIERSRQGIGRCSDKLITPWPSLDRVMIVDMTVYDFLRLGLLHVDLPERNDEF
jgi:hypothetical protein